MRFFGPSAAAPAPGVEAADGDAVGFDGDCATPAPATNTARANSRNLQAGSMRSISPSPTEFVRQSYDNVPLRVSVTKRNVRYRPIACSKSGRLSSRSTDSGTFGDFES